MKAYEALKDLPQTAAQADEFTRQIVSDLENGELDPLKFKIFLKAFERFMEGVKPTLDQMARDEAEKYGAKSFELMGAKVELKEAGTRYDYSVCNDTKLGYLESQAKFANSQMKDREKWLQSLKESMTIVNDLTGEIETVHPPVKKSSSIVQITLK